MDHDHDHYHHHKKEISLPISIIVGAILISVSILYGTKQIIKEFGTTGGVKTVTQGQNQVAPSPQAPAPAGVVDVAERDDAPTIGNKNAKVTFVEFSDFQCPFCQRFYTDAYKQIKTKYVDTGKVKIVFRHYPLPFHQNAQKAGEAAECAHRQGKFEPYHDKLFDVSQSDGTGLDVASLKKYASELGLNTSNFNSCLDNGDTAAIVQKDMADGSAAGVSGTPTMFINGAKVVGAQPFTAFETAIEAALTK